MQAKSVYADAQGKEENAKETNKNGTSRQKTWTHVHKHKQVPRGDGGQIKKPKLDKK